MFSKKKKPPNGGFRHVWSGREDYFAYALFTATIGFADRRLSARLSLVVEPPPSELRTLSRISATKKPPKGGFCGWSGREDSNLRLLAPHASALPG